MILQIHNKNIDKKRWNEVIANSQQCNVYALAEFLDIVSPEWEGLILNDYEAVFPLPLKHKFFFSYLVQPILSQQYSIYSNYDLPQTTIQEFLQKIIDYKSIRICLSQPFFEKCSQRTNCELMLSQPAKAIIQNYTTNTKRNIEKAILQNLHFVEVTASKILQVFFQFDTHNYYNRNQNEINKLVQNCPTKAYIVSSSTNEILAIAIFFVIGNRFTYLLPASSPKGKEQSAMFFLIHSIIQKLAGTNTIIDFEGSEIQGIRRFYEGFGAKEVPYYYFEKHKIPLLRYLIK